MKRWSVRRVALTVEIAFAGVLITLLAISNLREAGLLTDPSAAKASLLDVALPECDNAMTLQPQQESCPHLIKSDA
jgi:hypothetical protein